MTIILFAYRGREEHAVHGSRCDTNMPYHQESNDMRQLLLILLLSAPALCFAQEAKEDHLQYEQVEKFYSEGRCDKLTIPSEHRRQWSLLFLGDVLTGVVGGDSFSSDLWGDFDVFRIGRTPDDTLTALHDYASRKDVKRQVIKDLDAIEKAASQPEVGVSALMVLVCDLYKMSNGLEYAFKPEVETYLKTLNRKVRNKNLDNLLNLLEQPE